MDPSHAPSHDELVVDDTARTEAEWNTGARAVVEPGPASEERTSLPDQACGEGEKEKDGDVEGGAAVVRGVRSRLGVEDRYAPHLREYTVLLEYKHLPEHVPSGVFVLPSTTSLYEWHGVLFIRQGLYRKGIFKFVVTIPEAYPNVPPQLKFITPVFHPLISSQGEVDVTRAFPKGWVAYRDQIWCVLTYVKKLFYQIEIENALNIDAASLYLADFTKFKQKVSECVELSIEKVYINEQEDCCLQFLEWNRDFEKLRKTILEEDEDEGLISWVSRGVSKIINIRY